jgi:NADH-quinone oxidoreductase subunit G
VSETVSFKINGQAVSVPKGTTVMQAAQQMKIMIPHFCWHPGLSIAGVCRFCLVKIEGRPKLEIACNLQATDGMDVRTDTDEVKDAHKWALEFHLINHPLDCPICDQAGECGLQNYYMSVGKYQSQMERPKVLKPKALDVGGDLVLDTERCILCSRCVRFENEVTKSGALGIFDRGDHSIIGTFPGKKIDHNYTTNLVDICPVGAFTSKDFRFKQRVWFLKDKPATCAGCSTGCQVDVFAKEDTGTYYRMKPRLGEANGHWMCDYGRGTFHHLNQENRQRFAFVSVQGQRRDVDFSESMKLLATKLKHAKPGEAALLVSAQYTNEEYAAFFDFFVNKLGIKKVYQWREPTEKIADFDGLLLRGDRNSNTAGLLAAMRLHGVGGDKPMNQLEDLARSGAKVVVALVPEIATSFPSLKTHLIGLSELDFVSFWTVNGIFDGVADKSKGTKHVIPLKGFAEKRGTFTNQENKSGHLTTPFNCSIEGAHCVGDTIKALDAAYGKAH